MSSQNRQIIQRYGEKSGLDRVKASSGAAPERAVGLGLYIRRDLGGLRRRGVRHRRLRSPYCRLEGQPLGSRRLVLDALEQALHDRRPVSAAGSSIRAIAACNTYRSKTRSASPRPALNPP